jgi:hypothetical protein
MTYPYNIIETPHRGKPRAWVLESEKHLTQCIDFDQRRGYDGPYELEAWLDWLRSDLSRLEVNEDSAE